jgi:uncharacterized protein (TIGR03067 family)
LISADSPKEDEVVAQELELLQGTWAAISSEIHGKPVPEKEVQETVLTLKIAGDTFFLASSQQTGAMKGTLRVDSTKKPKTIDLITEVASGKTVTAPGIYELTPDTLKVCYGRQRPAQFRTKPDLKADQRLHVYKRASHFPLPADH